MIKRIGYSIIEQGRAAEWITSTILLGFALTLALPGNSLGSEAFRVFRDLGATESSISAPLAIVGTARMTALYINGHWRRSPFLRMAGAIMGASIFSMLAIAIFWSSWGDGHPLSPGAITYFVLALFDALAAYRSGADARVSAIKYP